MPGFDIRALVGRIPPRWLVRLAFTLYPQREYILYADQRLTRRQVYRQIQSLAAGLQALGLRQGDRIATLLPACPEAIYALYLPLHSGMVNVPLHPLLGEYELRHILKDCSARAVIAAERWMGRDYRALFHKLKPDLPDLEFVLLRSELVEGPLKPAGLPRTEPRDLSPARPPADGFLPLHRAMPPGARPHPVRIRDQDIARIFYTSGTTGLPKGVVHLQAGLGGLIRGSLRAHMRGERMRCMLMPLPPYQLAGMVAAVLGLAAGGKIILPERFNPLHILQSIPKEGVTRLAGAPTLYRLLLATPGQADYDLSSLQVITLATETCPLALAEALAARVDCQLENIYGLTETGIISMTEADDPWQRAADTVGRPYPGVEVRIVDDGRRPLPPGEVGEIAVRTVQVMAGYYRDPPATAQVLDADGWLYTGDLGSLGSDGYLRLVDRKRDLIIHSGINIYPAEVEAFLERHPQVQRAAVVGVPDALSGETVWAFIEAAPGAKLLPRQVREFCLGQLAAFKIPDQVRIVARLPLTVTNKVQKFRLRELALSGSLPPNPEERPDG